MLISKLLELINHYIDVPLQELLHNPLQGIPAGPIIVVCRLGNDSQIAANSLRDAERESPRAIFDMVGGLRAWSRDVDPEFPVY